MGNTIFGITAKETNSKFDDLFDVVYNDTKFIAQTKNTFHNDALHFDYKYMVTIEDTRERNNDKDNGLILSLCLFPTPSSLSEKHLKAICDFCEVEENELNAMDYDEYGFNVRLDSDYVDIPMDYDVPFENDPRLNLVASILPTIDALKGFYLDKPVNYSGKNGWDALDNAINDTRLF